MPIAPGTRIGDYEITGSLGAGGMGEVYRARDTRLKREVALKILPESFATDAERLARFQREAEVLAVLNHPNIAAIYGIEEADGTRALVMELVAGVTLADRIGRGRIPLDEALPIAKQIAEALEAAHEQGIIHRDLKPANIKLRPDGVVKVLDFGLAKALDSAPATIDASQSPTLTSPAMMTGVGVLLGTAAYMSPEQARGKTVDKRADIWAFGCVLYEMLTGKRAFQGEDVTETLAAILKSEPNWSVLPPVLPMAVRRLLRRALAKIPRERLSAIGDARLDIDEASAASSEQDTEAVGTTTRRLWRRAIPISAMAVIAAIGAVLAIRAATSSTPLLVPAVTRFSIAPPAGVVLSTGSDESLAISRDGRRIAYVGTRAGTPQLYVRSLDNVDSVPIRGSEGTGTTVFLSPDGEWVGFVSSGTIRKMPLAGGAPQTICETCATDTPSWGPNGIIIFPGLNGGLMEVSAAGGTPLRLTAPTGEVHREPHALADGRTVLFVIRREGQSDKIAVRSLVTGEQRELLDGVKPRFVTGGRLLFSRGAVLWTVPFDPERLQVLGDASRVLDGIHQGGGGNGSGFFDVASDGTLVYGPGLAPRRTLVWVDRSGQEEMIATPPRGYTIPRLSPDGSRVALEVEDQTRDIWIWDLKRGALTRVTSDPAADREPTWTPDGRRLVFASNRSGTSRLYWQFVDGSGPVAELTRGLTQVGQTSFSHDGRYVAATVRTPTRRGSTDIAVIEIGESGRDPSVDLGEGELLLHTGSTERNVEISPDGRWLAYESNESGQYDIYVRPFPEVDGARWQISNGGGIKPTWARDGRELFYQTIDRVMMVVSIQPGEVFATGPPRKLFDGGYYPPSGPNVLNERAYDVSADGRRFLMIKEMPSDTPGFVVVQHWFEELRRLVPSN